MAWTRKSSPPHFSSTLLKTASMVAGSVTSQWPATCALSSAASGSTRFFKRVALVGERELGARRARGRGDPPGERAVVGDAHDEAALAAHDTFDRRFHARPALLGSRGNPAHAGNGMRLLRQQAGLGPPQRPARRRLSDSRKATSSDFVRRHRPDGLIRGFRWLPCDPATDSDLPEMPSAPVPGPRSRASPRSSASETC